MSINLVQSKLNSYACQSPLEEEQALREITQEIVLAALGRSDFFGQAGFHGGTCLRIFHGLNRFSEDLDFALKEADPSFHLMPYLDCLCNELSAFGYAFEIEDRTTAEQAVQKAFLKDDSVGKILRLNYRPGSGPMRKLRVKLEVDTRPPAGATYEMPVLDYPFPSAIRVFDLASLFAGKMHALLCRGYVKGRDWYDFIWYTAHRVPINHILLSAALRQQGPWKDSAIETDNAWCKKRLAEVIETLDVKKARDDVRRFLRPNEIPSLELWTRDFFLLQCQKLP
ncbi:MAG: nucleotidyl transferase AbiEii/AbiGii toxin family protein [Opitutales bacterium]|nr:nucleotidyl transferase AbiEii/AbiGii toxin family protein [Opitutales bacterium]MCH8541234.1 nucleotidyl transferase AbiEii/AbiGii toxin family protein [Opitutales bacterium]